MTPTENKPNVPPRRDAWDDSPLAAQGPGAGAVRLQMPKPRTQQFVNRAAATHDDLQPPEVVELRPDAPAAWRGVSVRQIAIVSAIAVVWGSLAGWWFAVT